MQIQVNQKSETSYVSEKNNFKVNIGGDTITLTIKPITTEDQSAFSFDTDGLGDVERHHFEDGKMLYFNVEIVSVEGLKQEIEVKPLQLRNIYGSTCPKWLNSNINTLGNELLKKAHVIRRIENALIFDELEF